MKRNILALLAVAVLLLAGLGVWFARTPAISSPGHTPPPPPVAAAEAPPAEILGLTIGDPVDEARQRLDPLREPVVYTPDAKETSGRRIYWKLRETEFDWIMVWGNAEGKITRLRGYFRPDQTKPFHEIGDLRTAASVTSQMAKWNLRRTGGPYYRLIAQGTEHQAQTVYMFSLEQPGEQPQRRAQESEEED